MKVIISILLYPLFVQSAASEDARSGTLALVNNNTRNNILVVYSYEGRDAEQVIPPLSTVSLGLLSKIEIIRYNTYGYYKSSLGAKSDVAVNVEEFKKVDVKEGHPTIVVTSNWLSYKTAFDVSRPEAFMLLSMFPRAFRQLSYLSQTFASLGKNSMEQTAHDLGNIASKDGSYLVLGISKPKERSQDELRKLARTIYKAKVDTLTSKWFNNASGEELNAFMSEISRQILDLAYQNIVKKESPF